MKITHACLKCVRSNSILIILSAFFSFPASFAQVASLEVVTPQNGSVYNSPLTSIIFKGEFNVPPHDNDFLVTENGQKADVNFEYTDGYLHLKPLKPFAVNSIIRVQSSFLGPYWFKVAEQVAKPANADMEYAIPTNGKEPVPGAEQESSSNTKVKLPTLTRQIISEPQNGAVFLTLGDQTGHYPNLLTILNKYGQYIFTREFNTFGLGDFEQLTDSTIAYFDPATSKFYILNTNFDIVDSVEAQNGFVTDVHELLLDPLNGHYIFLAQQFLKVDMTQYFQDADTAAIVIGMVVQEVDKNKRIVFEWKSLDHISVLDAIGVNLKLHTIDYMHSNAICIHNVNSFLISSRHLNEITKINRQNGQIIWRWGLSAAHNDFTHINDPEGFSYQHDVRVLPNGHLTLFDNGNFRNNHPGYSRVVEYIMDEDAKTVNLVWEYRNQPGDYMSYFAGSARRLTNGNTGIGWGGYNVLYSEVDALGNKVVEYTAPTGVVSYRAYKAENTSFISKALPALNLPDTIHFCNVNKAATLNSISAYMSQAYNLDSQNLNVSMDGNMALVQIYNPVHNYYRYANVYLNFDNNTLPYNSITLCEGSKITINLTSNCSNASYLWSTGDSTKSVSIIPDNTQYYYVSIKNGSNIVKDSMFIKVSKLPQFNILGSKSISAYDVLTYSIPEFDSSITYHWDVAGGNIIGNYSRNSVSVQWGDADSNLLTCDITNPDNCIRSKSINVLLKKPGAVNEILTGNGTISIYPNPIDREFTVRSSESFELSATDISGKPLELIMGRQEKTYKTINVENLAAGIYFLRVTSASGQRTFKVQKI